MWKICSPDGSVCRMSPWYQLGNAPIEPGLVDETHEIRVIRVRRQPFVRVGHISHLEIGGEIPESTVMCLPDGTDPTNDLFRLFRGGRDRGDETEPKVVLIRRRHVTSHDHSSAK